MKSDNLIEFNNLLKKFPGVVALSNISFSIKLGEVHAICGENGAGKSTLINLCSGVLLPDSGGIIYKDKKVKIDSPFKAEKMKIATFHQEVPMCKNLTIAENIFLGPKPQSKYGFLDKKHMCDETLKLLKIFGLRHSPNELVKNLPLAEQSLIQIAKAIHSDPDFIILDEPTSSLSDAQKNMLFRVLKNIRKEKKLTILYVSHKLEEIFEIADKITVLRDGSYMGTVDASDSNIDAIIKMMVGRDIKKNIYAYDKEIGEVVMQVNNLSRGRVLKDVNFSLHKSEILGIAGFQGAGRTEVARAIFGLDKRDSGEILVEGKKVRIKNPEEAINLGMAMISENRKDEGIIPIMSVKSNMIMAVLKQVSLFGCFNKKRIFKIIDEYTNLLKIKVASYDQKVENLSGGNQQKVIIARWLAKSPKILICDEPTRGIDVGAKAEIHSILKDLSKQGLSIILISSELPELLSISDRVIVMHEGKVTGELSHKEASEEKIMFLAAAI